VAGVVPGTHCVHVLFLVLTVRKLHEGLRSQIRARCDTGDELLLTVSLS